MKTTTAVSVRNVSKIYPKGSGTKLSLRHQSGQLLKKWLLDENSRDSEPAGFQALCNINFDVYQGESLGIIGANGAGKTTLLRLLANITRPTTGTIQINGRFTALIGLGGGFNIDLTGRQNVFLNGAISGFSSAEMNEIIENIIAFADIGDFIDAPIREYSSGMKARLGFSIAVNLLPEVIFIDEILSVGDAAFKQKSQDYMFDMLSQNKTIVFVSHSLPAVKAICKRVIWLDQGEIRLNGLADDVIQQYELAVKSNRKQQST